MKMLVFPQKNQTKKFQSYADNYFNCLRKTTKKINIKKIEDIANEIIKTIKKKNNIYIAGNGGSASIANHFICDFNKSVFISTNSKLKPRLFSLSSSPEMITAISNDISDVEIFSKQLEMLAKSGDVLIVISCSGNSQNINNAIKFAKKFGLKIFFFCGFKERNIHKLKYFINLDCKNYGITEDIFTSIFHIISQFIRFKYSSKKEIL
jgi:phosphoheptose isomerase